MDTENSRKVHTDQDCMSNISWEKKLGNTCHVIEGTMPLSSSEQVAISKKRVALKL